MREKLPKILLVLILLLILGNLGYLDYQLYKQNQQSIKTEIETEAEKNKAEECTETCQQVIDQKISEAIAEIPTQPLKKSTNVVPTVAQTSQPKIIYVSVCSEGSFSSKDWTNIASCEFYFDLTDYPGVKEVRFVASLKMVNSIAQASARLYDLTNFRGVDYSDLLSYSTEFNRVESSGIIIWRGNNKYTVQLKSFDGSEVQLKEAKLKITF